MEDAHHQQQYDPQGRPGQLLVPLRYQHVGQQSQGGHAQLQDGLVESGDIGELFVHQHRGGVEHGGPQAAEDSQSLAEAGEAALQHAGDQHHAEKGAQNAEGLP